MIQRLRRLREDSGAMLIIALIIITVVAVVTGAVLSHGWTNFRATVGLRAVAGTSYAADASAKIAINNLRLGSQAPGWTTPTFPGPWANWVYTNNADGTGCFGAVGTQPDNSLELNGIYPRSGNQTADSSTRVECSVVPGTGIFGAGPGVGIDDPDPTDAFARALTTVGTTGTLQGMLLKPLGTGNTAGMPMRGGVASRSWITVDNGALVTDGYVKAEGACTGQIISNPAKQCNAPGSVPMPSVPPSPLAAVPTYRDPTTAGCTFQPGFYNNAARLTAAVNACSLARFASGKYYFDFVDEQHGGQNVWHITTTLIGGEEATGTSIPGRCKSPILHDPIPGVQFVFGGTSRITVSDTAHVEICGPSNDGAAPMTLYQQQTGSTETPVALPAVSAAQAQQRTGNAGGNKWTTGVFAPAPDERTAVASADTSAISWAITGNNDDIGLDLRDFAGLASIPPGADITSAELRVKYAKTSARALTATVQGQSPANVAVSAPDAAGWGTAQLADQLRTLLQSGPLDASRPVVELRMMDAAVADTLAIDAVTLAVTYLPPSLRPAQDVTFINSPGGNFHGEFVVQGAAFAPNGFVALDPGSFEAALVSFRWGLVALGVDFMAQPSQEFGFPLVSIPDAGQGLGNKVTVVDLEVFVCAEQATCASGGRHALTVRVMITDPPYPPSTGAPVPGKRRVEVLGWAEQN